ncbi:unnamed protein product [Heligmosomoides polygyrus]|uniref:CCHC-type domain-containing protein n=1 Tax=Heligmosomoides polygyrus TaxID=6339 RepID=A0A183FWJ3_HELPZ|nr:unnamed protein product [Heligmosomoides polygyrus]
MERWTELVVASLDCDSRDDFVRKLANTIVTSKVVDQLKPCVDKKRRCANFERQKYQEQSEELQKLRQQAKQSSGAAQECSRQSPGWLRAICQSDDVDPTRCQADLLTAWTPDSENRRIALPEVVSYSGEESWCTFRNFLEAFELKYPTANWADAELTSLFRSLREGERPVRILAWRAERRTNKIVALGQLRKLRMLEGQSVADFCVKLERLTRVAYPELDEEAMDTERAHLLYDQLVHWNDSYHLTEALESERGAYNRVKETAKTIERRNLTLRSIKGGHVSGVSNEARTTPMGKAVNPGQRKTRVVPEKPMPQKWKCYICHEFGHLAKDCAEGDGKAKTEKKRAPTSLSARAGQAVDRWVETDKEWKEANVSDIPADMLTQPTEKLSDEERMSVLRRTLTENRKEGELGRKL